MAKGSNNNILIVDNLHVSVEGYEILKGVNLRIPKGEVHALMGPNGAGKSTLAYALMGHPAYRVTEGSVFFHGENLLNKTIDERAREGLFLAFQYPREISGLKVFHFLKKAYISRFGIDEGTFSSMDFFNEVKEKTKLLKMKEDFINRYLNEGFSGGEKKRMEILQMAMLKPEMAILDEPDSGLDIDAVRIVAEGVNSLRGPDIGVLLVTHYQRILNYIKPDVVHILVDGKVVKSGGPELAEHLETAGYEFAGAEV
ncbi:MAG: Fe-S cluster assembly ATPase SufC [Spirochaetes bacterium]|nr:MAG: Fe-S cluster assembly ATPase SufC [Spirochaetota bacterium]